MTSLPNICVRVIEHQAQLYDTAGDYNEMAGQWFLRISKLGDWRMEFLVLMHELIEMGLTRHRGVDWATIDAFDKEGGGKDHPDPGTLESAPYHTEHELATAFETQLAMLLDVDWEEYNKVLDSLEYK